MASGGTGGYSRRAYRGAFCIHPAVRTPRVATNVHLNGTATAGASLPAAGSHCRSSTIRRQSTAELGSGPTVGGGHSCSNNGNLSPGVTACDGRTDDEVERHLDSRYRGPPAAYGTTGNSGRTLCRTKRRQGPDARARGCSCRLGPRRLHLVRNVLSAPRHGRCLGLLPAPRISSDRAQMLVQPDARPRDIGRTYGHHCSFGSLAAASSSSSASFMAVPTRRSACPRCGSRASFRRTTIYRASSRSGSRHMVTSVRHQRIRRTG